MFLMYKQAFPCRQHQNMIKLWLNIKINCFIVAMRILHSYKITLLFASLTYVYSFIWVKIHKNTNANNILFKVYCIRVKMGASDNNKCYV